MSEFTLAQLQNEMLGQAHNLILPEEHHDEAREMKQKSVRKIVELYTKSRNNGRIYKATYEALKDRNPWTRMAAAELICEYGTPNSFEHLFKAMEDEPSSKIKQKIAKSINKLECRLNNLEETPTVSLTKVSKLLTYEGQ